MQPPKQELNTGDIQGILVRSYSYLTESCLVMIRFNDLAKARLWLSKIAGLITAGDRRPEEFAIQIAFTNQGIFRFLPEERFQECFSREFTEGLTEEVRSRVLGDTESNDSAKWCWGGKSKEVDGVLMMYAIDKKKLDSEYQHLQNEFTLYDIMETIRLDTSNLPGNKEHFGFHDGISQPRIKGLEKVGAKNSEA